MVAGSPARVGYRTAFASRELRALFAAQLVSIGGTSVAAVALTIAVYRRSGSPVLSALTFAFAFLPYVLGGGLLGGIVDRLPPRRLVSGAALLSTPLAAALAWPSAPVPLLLALVFAIGTLSSLASGGSAALVRSSVPEDAYVPARSLIRIASQLAQVGGNAAGGVLVVALGSSGALLLNAGSFAFAALVVRLGVAERPRSAARPAEPLLGHSLRSARDILARPELRRLMFVGWIIPLCSVAPEALAAPYVAAHHGSPSLVGWWLVALPVGVIAGDVAGVRLLGTERLRRLVAPAACASLAPYLLFLLDPAVPVGIVLLVVAGVGGVYGLGLDARLRDTIPPELFARAMALNSAGLIGLQGLGFALAGAAAEGVGPARAIVIAGAVGTLATALLLRGDLRRRP